MTIQIWGKPACPSCEKAKQILLNRNIAFEYLQLGTDFDRDKILETFPDARTFPQIIMNGKKIGGVDNLIQELEDTNYNGTGHSIS